MNAETPLLFSMQGVCINAVRYPITKLQHISRTEDFDFTKQPRLLEEWHHPENILVQAECTLLPVSGLNYGGLKD